MTFWYMVYQISPQGRFAAPPVIGRTKLLRKAQSIIHLQCHAHHCLTEPSHFFGIPRHRPFLYYLSNIPYKELKFNTNFRFASDAGMPF